MNSKQGVPLQAPILLGRSLDLFETVRSIVPPSSDPLAEPRLCRVRRPDSSGPHPAELARRDPFALIQCKNQIPDEPLPANSLLER